MLTFSQVEIPGLQARYLHSATAFTLTPGLCDIVIFGGCPELPSEAKLGDAQYQGIAKTTVLQFGKLSLTYGYGIALTLVLLFAESQDCHDASTEDWVLLDTYNIP